MVGFFLYISNRLVNDLTIQERERMEVWAGATRQIARVTEIADNESAFTSAEDLEFLLSILAGNHTIPVLLTDANGTIIDQRNFDLPEPADSISPLSDTNLAYLEAKLQQLKQSNNIIQIVISPDNSQYLYYDDSKLLKRLGYYPYIQLLVMIAFIGVVYFALTSTKRAEQNKVWVGLSKETAHQLGTPISSLMAWMELLESLGVDPETVKEMNKDVNRPAPQPVPVNMSAPLFEWVMENLIKNAVDAMEGTGSITVAIGIDGNNGYVTVSDTGKGISRKNFKTIFNPGYTTKTRGWGLGLTLAKRIIDQYHRGEIYVKESEPGRGTTFRIDIPLQQKDSTD